MVLDKANGGKADALNAGLNAARYPLVCCVDADGLLEPDAVRQMACLLPAGRTPWRRAAWYAP